MSDSKIMSDSHWLGRIKDLMQQVGMPASQSLYLAFTQLMFEMQRAHLVTRPATPEAAIAAWNSRTALAAASHAAQEPSFDDWWNADKLTQTNPYDEDTPVYWAWEGWQAALEAPRAALPEEKE